MLFVIRVQETIFLSSAVQRLIIFICEMVLGKRLAGRQKNLQPGGVG